MKYLHQVIIWGLSSTDTPPSTAKMEKSREIWENRKKYMETIRIFGRNKQKPRRLFTRSDYITTDHPRKPAVTAVIRGFPHVYFFNSICEWGARPSVHVHDLVVEKPIFLVRNSSENCSLFFFLLQDSDLRQILIVVRTMSCVVLFDRP